MHIGRQHSPIMYNLGRVKPRIVGTDPVTIVESDDIFNISVPTVTVETNGLMSYEDKITLEGLKQVKPVTSIRMNGQSLSFNRGLVDLGTVLTSHQDISGKLDANRVGAANGVAELDANGKVPSYQLPSYVDDVIEATNVNAFPATGEAGKIYVSTSTNLTYRWTGSGYAEISQSIAIGETSSTAYRGDRGKVAYDHSTIQSGNPHKVSKSDLGLSDVPNYNTSKAIAKITRSGTTFTYTCLDGTTGTFDQKDDNTVYSIATSSANGLMSKEDKAKLDSMNVPSILKGSSTIPVTGWSSDNTSMYPNYIDVTISGVTADHVPSITIATASLKNAINCALSPIVETRAGSLRFRSSDVPSSAIGFTYYCEKI